MGAIKKFKRFLFFVFLDLLLLSNLTNCWATGSTKQFVRIVENQKQLQSFYTDKKKTFLDCKSPFEDEEYVNKFVVHNDDGSVCFEPQNFTLELDKTQESPTLSYLRSPELRKNVEGFIELICSYPKLNLSKEFFEQFINNFVSKEIEFKDEYFSLCHAQMREFLLLQDLFLGLYKLIKGKALKDFIPLRIHGKKYKKFDTIKDFLREHSRNKTIEDDFFDHRETVKNVLLAANPSLFGNSQDTGECTFAFFIGSDNVSYVDFSDLLSRLFDFFKVSNLHKKYQENIEELLKLLSADEPDKTGILIQIFVPKKHIDKIAYRCKPFGQLFHKDFENNNASQDLNRYQSNNLSGYGIPSLKTKDMDGMQLRLLMNQMFTNPELNKEERPLFFRYFNTTKKVVLYQKRLNQLLAQIATDLS